MLKFSTQKLARAGVIGALYVVLSLITFPVASGAIQFRISEAFTVLPLIFPEATIGLFVGCVLTGIITGCAIYDVVFGSLITLVAGMLTFVVGKAIKNKVGALILGGVFPVILNALLLPVIWYFCYGQLEYLYVVQVGFLLISQSVSVYGIGSLLYFSVHKLSNAFIDKKSK